MPDAKQIVRSKYPKAHSRHICGWHGETRIFKDKRHFNVSIGNGITAQDAWENAASRICADNKGEVK